VLLALLLLAALAGWPLVRGAVRAVRAVPRRNDDFVFF
jgi:hypothetical protein